MTTDGTPVEHALYYWLRLVEGHLNRKLFSDMLDRSGALPLWPSRSGCAGFSANRGGVRVAQLYTVAVLRIDSKSCEWSFCRNRRNWPSRTCWRSSD